jgi:hypothetical protein
MSRSYPHLLLRVGLIADLTLQIADCRRQSAPRARWSLAGRELTLSFQICKICNLQSEIIGLVASDRDTPLTRRR